MPYTKKAIGRPAGGAGNPSPKNPHILIFDMDDVENYPVREVGVTVADDGFKLKEGAKLQPVYATPDSIELLQEAEGEADARGYKKGVKFAHPGTSTDMEDFTEYNTNRNLGAIVRGCRRQRCQTRRLALQSALVEIRDPRHQGGRQEHHHAPAGCP